MARKIKVSGTKQKGGKIRNDSLKPKFGKDHTSKGDGKMAKPLKGGVTPGKKR